MLSAAEVIRLLELRPHPEGGHYRQTFRDGRLVHGDVRPRPRSISCWRAASARIGTRSMRSRSGTTMRVRRSCSRSPRMTGGRSNVSRWARTSRPASAHKRWCRRIGGRRREVSAIGRWSAARWRRVSSSRASSWRCPIGSPAKLTLTSSAQRSCPWRQSGHRRRSAARRARAPGSRSHSRRAPGRRSRAAAPRRTRRRARGCRRA